MSLFTSKLSTALVADCTLNEHLNSYNSSLWVNPIKKKKVWEHQSIEILQLKIEAFMSLSVKKGNKIRLCLYPIMEKTWINKFIPEKAKLPQLCLEVCLLDALDCHCEISTYKRKGKNKTIYTHQSESAKLLSYMLIVTWQMLQWQTKLLHWTYISWQYEMKDGFTYYSNLKG